MSTLFLIIIYLSFISLGLPDSLLGSAWPIMQTDLGAAFSSAGVLSMIITAGTIVSSFLSGKLINRFGTGNVTFISVTMTAAALFGFYSLPSFYWLCFAAIPLGLGAGAVDSALNNFVAVHYKASHMSWLHCFWGIGATAGPMIMSLFIFKNNQWRNGYFTISIIQFCLVFILLFTLPLWKKFETKLEKADSKANPDERKNIFKISGLKIALLSFFCYCAAEMTTGLWGSSYLVKYRGVPASQAAQWISLFYVGITIGRFISGFVTMKLSSAALIRIGQILCGCGVLVLLFPLPLMFSAIGLVLIGLGYAPIYPAMLHETPHRFGEQESRSIMGIQMAFAYIGTTLIPPLMGFLATQFTIAIFPYFLLILIVTMAVSNEKINLLQKGRSQ